MTILPAFSSATISSVEARIFCIALYFKLRRLFSGYSADSTPKSSISDDRSPFEAFFCLATPEKMPDDPIYSAICLYDQLIGAG
jgi:hypothetical protein